jgi:polysaccharide deacetylase family protein (PEP-CTERM system associated)
VDVEDYFQVSAFERVVPRDSWDAFERRVFENTNRLLALFSEFDVRGTFFVLGWVADREPDLVRRIAAAGHEVACHGYWHRLVFEQTPDEFRDDLRRAKAVLEALCGRPVVGYRAPSYSITLPAVWAFDVLAEEGFVYDASIFPIHHDRYGIPSAPRHPHFAGTPYPQLTSGRSMLELPPSTVRVAGTNLPVGGGGYFRVLPYRWTRWGISRLNRLERRPAIFYLHPWEIDPAQPRLDGPGLSRFRHHRNLQATETRLRRLLSDFRFDTIARAILPECVDGAAPATPRSGSRS